MIYNQNLAILIIKVTICVAGGGFDKSYRILIFLRL
jgi:hypothetical protein